MTREQKRTQFIEKIPGWYNGYLHFGLINAGGLTILAASLAALQDPKWWEWLFVPISILFANFVEWWVHQGWMHHPSPWLKWPYLAHAAEHHVIFTDDDMQFRHPRELYFILAHPFYYPIFIAVGLPLPIAAAYLVSTNLAWMFVISIAGYYVLYEWFHTVHHWPRDTRVGRSAFARLVRGHHTRHHDPKRMTKGNFNVSFPLADHVLGTVLDVGGGTIMTDVSAVGER